MVLSTSILCMALIVYHEGRGELVEGQQEIAQIVYNRALGKPENICKVVNKIGQFHNFTKKIQREYLKRKKEEFEIAMKVSMAVINKGKVTLTTHFHTLKVKPPWSKEFKRIKKIGNHIFYEDTKHGFKYF